MTHLVQLTRVVVWVTGAEAVLGATPHVGAGGNAVATVARVTLVPPDCAVGPQVAAPLASLRGLDGGAVGLHQLTAASSASRRTQTSEVCYSINAGTAEGTRGGGTLVDVDAAVRSSETRHTLTHTPVNAVHAESAIVARVGRAVVDVVDARDAVPAVRTQARETVASIDTRGTVMARRGVTCSMLGCGTKQVHVQLFSKSLSTNYIQNIIK